MVTVCADVHRFSKWCEQRDADPAYDNFAWFLNASTDALLAAQNLCVEAEMHGLGICYLGTTIYTAGDISQILELPKGVIPLTTVVLGYPDESPELTDRLPVAARGTLYLLAILAIAVFGVWGAGYSAQAFIYFQF